MSSTNKSDRHDIADILLKVALNIIKQTTTRQSITKQSDKPKAPLPNEMFNPSSDFYK
jgi:hypothetical protein